ncbi:MAG: B12-binding domain-containing radical SAM protein [Candidatus Sericytochromatia bacterium]
MPLTIGLVQYNTNYRAFLPYALGLLQAAIPVFSSRPEHYRFLVPRVFMAPLADEAEDLAAADVVAFSLYSWNQRRSLALAAELKARRPEVITVFGGPHVPDRAENWLRQYPQVDYACHGEGEEVFARLLDSLPAAFPEEGIPGVSRLANGEFQHFPPAPRRRELSVLPSPYLSGTFDALMQSWPGTDWAGLWETNRGCPFSCAFCDWGSATQSKVFRFDDERLWAELAWFAAHQIGYIFCCDANFGILPRDLELARRAAAIKAETGFPRALAVQNAKNTSERSFEIQCILAEAGLDSHATLSLQSLYGPALEASQRSNISLGAFSELQKRLRAKGIHTYTDLIQGLPGETLDSFCEGVARTIESGQMHAINCYIADILPNAAMAAPAYLAKHGIETVTVPSANFHTPVVEDADGIVETRELVIATATMPRADWVKARVFSWSSEFLFFKPGTVRIPLWLLHRVGGVPMRQLLEAFLTADPAYPVTRWVQQFLRARAEDIQRGGAVYTPGLEADGQFHWWGAFEAALDLLLRQGRLPLFYQEAGQILEAQRRQSTLPASALVDALFLSASFTLLYYRQEMVGLDYTTQWNVWEWYQAELRGETGVLEPATSRYVKDWNGAPWRLKRLANPGARPLQPRPEQLSGR